MAKTWFEEGMEKGEERGKRGILQRQLEKRFGPLLPQALAQLQSWTIDRLDEIGLALLDAKSLDDLGLGETKHA